jgi:hypothetical protein
MREAPDRVFFGSTGRRGSRITAFVDAQEDRPAVMVNVLDHLCRSGESRRSGEEEREIHEVGRLRKDQASR